MSWPTDPQALEPYDFLMEKVLGKVPSTPIPFTNIDQEQVEKLMDLVAYHETGGTMDPSQKQISQHWSEDDGYANVYPKEERLYEGPAKGLYQYELKSGRTAINRLLNIYSGGKEDNRTHEGYTKLPGWAKKYFNINNSSKYPNDSGDVDFSELTEEQQKVLFLADKLGEKDAIKDIGKMSDAEWWEKYHKRAAGDTELFNQNRSKYINNQK